MKAAFRFLVPVAIATLALVSCQKETDIQVVDELGTVHITVKASANDLQGETRTYIDDNKTIIWGTGEYMKIAVTGKNADGDVVTAFATSSADYADTWAGDAEAYFGFTLQNPPVQGIEGTFLHQGLYPASAAVSSSNSNPETYKVNLLGAQNATASSYDPAAYIMVAKPESFNEIQEEWTASYRRATALNKVTLKNFTGAVKSVKFILPEDKDFTGRRHINLSTGESDDVYEGSNAVEVFFATPLQDSDNTGIPVWFTSWEAEVASGEQMTVEVYSGNKVYSKTITAGTKGISFKEGYLNTLGINMQGIEGETLEDYSGDYLIGSMKNGTWNLMSSTNPGSYFNHTATSVNKVPAEIVYTDFSNEVDVNDYIWRVAKDANGYYIKNLVAGNYLAIKNDSNESRSAESLTDEGLYPYFTISISDGLATITSTHFTSRVLYGNAGSSRFAFYTSQGSMQSVYLIPATYDERTPVSLTFEEASISRTTENYNDFTGQAVIADPTSIASSIVYTMEGDEIGTIVSNSGVVSLNGNPGTATVTASYAGNETYRNAKASYTITVTSTSAPTFVQVTSLENVTAGTYVIVNDGYYLPNAAATSSGPVKNNDTKVTVQDGKVMNVTDDMTWEFSGTTSAMTIKSTIEGNYYLVVTGSGNANLRVNTTTGRTWTIAANGTGAFSLMDNTNNRYCASYSGGSDWRSYTSATASNYGDGGKIYLYKLTSGGDGGDGQDDDSPKPYYKFSGSAGDHFVSNSAYTYYDGTAVNALSSIDSSYPSQASWKMTCGDAQDSGKGDLWFGSNSGSKDKLTLSNGDYTEGSAIATALNVSAESKYYGALICTTNFSNICKIEVTSAFEMGGGAATTMWVLKSTDNGNTYSVVYTKESPAKAANTVFTVELDEPAESASYALVFYRSGGQFQYKAPQITFYTK